METGNDKLLKLVKKNREDALGIFNEYYDGKATEEGEEMMYDSRFGYDEENDEVAYDSAIECYEDYSHCCGHSASYEGAYGVIKYYTEEHNLDIDPNDEELQIEVMDVLDVNPY